MTYEWDLLLMSAVIFVPTLFALVLLFFPKGTEEGMRWWSLAGTVATLVLTIILFIDYYQKVLDPHNKEPEGRAVAIEQIYLSTRAEKAVIAQAEHRPPEDYDLIGRVPWIKRFNVDYYLGADGISIALVLLTSLLSVLAMIASWNIEKSVKGYCILFLILETGMLGTFLALDLFLFYIFWEIMLLPMYFLIGIWGGPRREYAAIKFFLYTLLGSVLILIAILAFYFKDLRPLEQQLQQTMYAKMGIRDKAKQEFNQDASDSNKRAYEDAQRDLERAEQDYRAVHAVARANAGQPINTFDIPLLQKVGHESARLEFQYREVERASGAEAAEASTAGKERRDFLIFSREFQIVMFVLLFIGFAIKVPIFPFHTWLPDAHVEAPTPISMILAGVLLKMGGYGLLRIAYPICPWAAYELAWGIALLGIINIVYGAFAAMAQTDFKKLVAYSSISHMGYVILGIAVWTSLDRSQYWSWGVNGAMFQMIAHGITSAGMFFLVGVLYDRIHHRDLNRMGGISNAMPLYAGISAVIFFGAMGLPGLCGFPGEFFTILGTWNYSQVFAVLAAVTVVITAAYILWTIQRVYLGKETEHHHALPEITLRELICITPLVILTVLLGVWPSSLLMWVEPSVTGFVQDLARITQP